MNKPTAHSQSRVLLALMAIMLLCSCTDRYIFEGEGDCGVYYRIRFKYDYNMKYADAFAHEVHSLALFVFDEQDTLVHEVRTADSATLASGTFEIPLELPAGNYQLVAWGGLADESSFDLLADTEVGHTTLEEMKVKMQRRYDSDGRAIVTEDLLPLYHGTRSLSVSSVEGTYTETLSMTKNTNVIRVMLQELSGGKVDAEKFTFEITDSSGYYAWDNSWLTDEPITFSPWSLTTGTADMEEYTRATTTVSVALAEHTIGRMRAGASPILTVKERASGKEVFRIPVADYALLTKGYYNNEMSDQEYLDRQDEYAMTFFLNEGKWLSSVILINSWRVVLNIEDLD